MNDKLELGKKYIISDCSTFNSAFIKKVEGRIMIIDRIFKRLGASERSFDCKFLPLTKRHKEFNHVFMEFENLRNIVKEVN